MSQLQLIIGVEQAADINEHFSPSMLRRIESIIPLLVSHRMNTKHIKRFVTEIVSIGQDYIANFVEPGMDTNAGVFFRGTKETRGYARTIVLLKACLLQLTKTDNREWNDLKAQGQKYKKLSSKDLEKLCDTLINEITNFFLKEERLEREIAQREQEGKDKARKDRWAKVSQATKKIGEEYRLYKKVGEAALDKTKQNQAKFLLNAQRAEFARKQAQINTMFMQQGISIKNEVTPITTTATKAFDDAVESANHDIEERREFRKNLARNFFGAVKNYAPPPFNLVGSFAQAAIDAANTAASVATNAYETFGSTIKSSGHIGETVWNQGKGQFVEVKKQAWEIAKGELTKLENLVHGDVGLSDFNAADDLNLQMQFERAREKAFTELTEALGFIVVKDQLKSSHSLQDLFRARMRGPHGNVWHDAGLNTNKDDLNLEMSQKLPALFEDSRANAIGNLQSQIDQIDIPVWQPKCVKDDLNRYLTLYMMGQYLHVELTKDGGASESGVNFKLEAALRDLMRKVAFTHSSSRKGKVTIQGGKISLPYSRKVGGSWRENHADFARLTCLLRLYAFSEFTPFNMVMQGGDFAKAETFLQTENNKLDISATTNSAAAREIERKITKRLAAD